MSELRHAMIDQMLLKGFSARTKKSYLDAVSLLARHYHQSPDKLTQPVIQAWFLHLVKDRKLAPATCRLYLNAVRFFYLQVLHWGELQLVLDVPKTRQRIPDLLSPSEVALLLASTKQPKYRMMFTVCYACGLRLSELIAIQVRHIHSEPMYLQVVQGKGAKDRNIPIAITLLSQLRDYWHLFHPAVYLFPGRDLTRAISATSVQKVYTQSKACAAITKTGGIHSLRHAFATHQLMGGMPIHQLKELLGHTNLKSTERYLHWSPQPAIGHVDLLAQMPGGHSDE